VGHEVVRSLSFTELHLDTISLDLFKKDNDHK
jgi:hypothetical protein